MAIIGLRYYCIRWSIYTYFHNIETLIGQNKFKKKIGQQCMPHAKEIFPRAIVDTRHSFVSPDLLHHEVSGTHRLAGWPCTGPFKAIRRECWPEMTLISLLRYGGFKKTPALLREESYGVRPWRYQWAHSNYVYDMVNSAGVRYIGMYVSGTRGF